MELKYHTDSFIEIALQQPEPKESLEKLEERYQKACDDYVSNKKYRTASWVKSRTNEKGETETYIDYEDWEKEDPNGLLSWSIAEFNMSNYIDFLEEQIDIKICHISK